MKQLILFCLLISGLAIAGNPPLPTNAKDVTWKKAQKGEYNYWYRSDPGSIKSGGFFPVYLHQGWLFPELNVEKVTALKFVWIQEESGDSYWEPLLDTQGNAVRTDGGGTQYKTTWTDGTGVYERINFPGAGWTDVTSTDLQTLQGDQDYWYKLVTAPDSAAKGHAYYHARWSLAQKKVLSAKHRLRQ